ncbi:MAG: hypothetical protein AB7G93_11220 [Bdellovibrionales bacterium]
MKSKMFTNQKTTSSFRERQKIAQLVGAVPNEYQELAHETRQRCKESDRVPDAMRTSVESLLGRSVPPSPSGTVSADDRNSIQRKQYLAMMEAARLSRSLQDHNSGLTPNQKQKRLAMLKLLLEKYPLAAPFVNSRQAEFQHPGTAKPTDGANEKVFWQLLLDDANMTFDESQKLARRFEQPSASFARYAIILQNKSFPYERQLKLIIEENLRQTLRAIRTFCEADPCKTFAIDPHHLSQETLAYEGVELRAVEKSICSCGLNSKADVVPDWASPASQAVVSASAAACLMFPPSCPIAVASAVAHAAVEVTQAAAATVDYVRSSTTSEVAEALPGASGPGLTTTAQQTADDRLKMEQSGAAAVTSVGGAVASVPITKALRVPAAKPKNAASPSPQASTGRASAAPGRPARLIATFKSEEGRRLRMESLPADPSEFGEGAKWIIIRPAEGGEPLVQFVSHHGGQAFDDITFSDPEAAASALAALFKPAAAKGRDLEGEILDVLESAQEPGSRVAFRLTDSEVQKGLGVVVQAPGRFRGSSIPMAKNPLNASSELAALKKQSRPSLVSRLRHRDRSTRSKPEDLPEYSDHDILFLYQTVAHREVNRELKMGGAAVSSKTKAFTRRLVSILDRMPPYQGATVRFEELSALEMETYANAIVTGEPITMKIFLSTSKTERGAKAGAVGSNTLFRIKGRSGRDISTPGDVEEEVLFKPGTRFRVTGESQRGSVKIYDLEEIS